MANFMENLWASVFVPGPTSTLLVATNLSFGALSLVLLALLAFTRSVHFLILSILAGALWWSINWFAAEVRLAQEREEKAHREGGDGGGDGKIGEGEGDVAGDELSSGSGDGDETEVEAEKKQVLAAKGAMAPPPRVSSASSSTKPLASSTGASGRLVPDDATRQRQQRRSMAESTGSLSTDSEWEKVEGER